MQEVYIYICTVFVGAVVIRLLPTCWRRVILVLYILAVLLVTLLTREPMSSARISLVVFKKLRNAIKIDVGIPDFVIALFRGDEIPELNVQWKRMGTEPILNILLFVPLGYLLPASFASVERHPWVMIPFGFLFSLAIESIQLVTHLGWFDIDDLINNSLGCVLGVIAWTAILRKRPGRE